jgi:hypothetical protein
MPSVQQFERCNIVLLHVMLYTIMCTHAELLTDIDRARNTNRVMSRYCVMFKPY